MDTPIPVTFVGKSLVLPGGKSVHITTASVVTFHEKGFDVLAMKKSIFKRETWNDAGHVIPGGTVEDHDESVAHIALREMCEESGVQLSLNDIALFGYREYDNKPGDGHAYLLPCFATSQWSERRRRRWTSSD